MRSFLVAEDHSVVRMGAVLIIKQLYPDAIVMETETFHETIEQLQAHSFDLVLLDIHMPGGDNLQMVEAVRLRQPKIPILIFSSYDEQMYAIRYLKAGANGYLHKNASTEVIKAAITRVLQGEKYMSPKVQDKLLEAHFNPKSERTDSLLSNREMEIMQLLIKGVTIAQIKKMLNIQSSTLSTHKARIFEKMEVTNTIELVAKVQLMETANQHHH